MFNHFPLQVMLNKLKRFSNVFRLEACERDPRASSRGFVARSRWWRPVWALRSGSGMICRGSRAHMERIMHEIRHGLASVSSPDELTGSCVAIATRILELQHAHAPMCHAHTHVRCVDVHVHVHTCTPANADTPCHIATSAGARCGHGVAFTALWTCELYLHLWNTQLLRHGPACAH